MNSAKDRIKGDFEAFCRRVETCREKKTDPIEGKDARGAALEGLYTLMERIKKELKSKDRSLEKDIQKLLYDAIGDTCLKEVLELRTIWAHIRSNTAMKKNEYITIHDQSGREIKLPASVSAHAVFVHPIYVSPIDGNRLDHLGKLEQAERRLKEKYLRYLLD